MREYKELVEFVLANGTRKENRTGIDTISVFGYHYKVDLADGFPLLTTKFVSWKNIVIEMLWFLSGQTNIDILKRHGCKFWDAWADPVSGEVPSAYGHFWRHFPDHDGVMLGENGKHEYPCGVYNDQILWAIHELRRNPLTRRAVITAWAPGNAQMSKLPPCHCTFVLNTQVERDGSKRLNLALLQRSADVALGIPYNIASYALLLHLIGRFTGLDVGEFSHTLVDAHVYTAKPDGSMAEYDHIPGLREQLQRTCRLLPTLKIDSSINTIKDIEELMHPDVGTETILELIKIEGYSPAAQIPFKVAV
jgi:thymidylate synthase